MAKWGNMNKNTGVLAGVKMEGAELRREEMSWRTDLKFCIRAEKVRWW